MSTEQVEPTIRERIIEAARPEKKKDSDPMTDLASKIHDLIVDSKVGSYEAVGALALCQAVWSGTYRRRMFEHNFPPENRPEVHSIK